MNGRRFTAFLPGCVSFVLALLGGVVLFNNLVISNLASFIITIGLDPLRAQLIAALIMTAGAALVGAAGGRRKVGAMLGAGSMFCFSYLMAFIQLELQPFHNPGGILEPLNSDALLYTACVMLALALLCAFVGAAVGKALGEVLLDPPYLLLRLIWQRSMPGHAHKAMQRKEEMTRPYSSSTHSVREIVGSWLGTLIMLSLILLASGASDLFIFSPDIGLHKPPLLHTKDGAAHSTIVQDEVVSPALNMQRRSFLVYLPPSYNTAQGRNKRYPTLYLLHGSPGGERDWFSAGKADQSADTLIALNKMSEVILILPDGNGRPGSTSEWGNSFDHRQNIETYVALDLVKYVDQKYRTIAEAAYRGIGGLSMGGFGAMNIAVHHPDVFGFVISLGGYYRAEGSIWGGNAAYIRENSPLDVLPTVARAWQLHIYIGAATKDQPYYSDSKQFVQELDRLHIPYHLDIQNGFHSWGVWQTQLYNAFLWLHWG
ncbi:MAG: alpha/beta hydrolase [Ktedonobacteraceae bacterium]